MRGRWPGQLRDRASNHRTTVVRAVWGGVKAQRQVRLPGANAQQHRMRLVTLLGLD